MPYLLNLLTVAAAVLGFYDDQICYRQSESLVVNGGSSGPAVVYALRRRLITITMHSINGWCRIAVAVNLPMRVDAR